MRSTFNDITNPAPVARKSKVAEETAGVQAPMSADASATSVQAPVSADAGATSVQAPVAPATQKVGNRVIDLPRMAGVQAPTPAPTVQSAVPAVPTQTTPAQINALTAVQEYEAAHPNHAESEEEKAKRLRIEKRNKTIAGVSDAITALSNMYFATKGAKPFTTSLTGSQQARYDKLDAIRKQDQATWEAGRERAAQLDAIRAKSAAEDSRFYENLKAKNEEAKMRIEMQRLQMQRQAARDEKKDEQYERTYKQREEENKRRDAARWAKARATAENTGGSTPKTTPLWVDENETIEIPTNKLNTASIASALEQSGMAKSEMDELLEKLKTTKESRETMLVEIGKMAHKNPKLLKVLRSWAGAAIPETAAPVPQSTGAYNEEDEFSQYQVN